MLLFDIFDSGSALVFWVILHTSATGRFVHQPLSPCI